MAGLAPQLPIPSGMLPPEMLTGMMNTAEKISGDLDALGQTAPDLAADFLLIKDLLQRAMAKLLMAGGGPAGPTDPGQQFAGGGMSMGGRP
jgi:hypothetical protein